MRMLMAVVQKSSGEAVLDGLVNAGYTATYSETRGGMLRQSQISMWIAVKEENLDEVLTVIKEKCKLRSHVHIGHQKPERFDKRETTTLELGGAVIFIWKLEDFQIL